MTEETILKQINGRIKQISEKDHEITQLELDYISIKQFTKRIKNHIENYKNITYLTLNSCDLVSLNNFPKLPNLTILQLSNNKITDDQLYHLLINSSITHLMLDENQLRSVEKISVLRQLPDLEQLEVGGNFIGETDFYRDQMFQRIPQLKILDCQDNMGNLAVQSGSEDELEGGDNRDDQDSQNEQSDQSVKSDNSISSGLKKLLKNNKLSKQKQKQKHNIEQMGDQTKKRRKLNNYLFQPIFSTNINNQQKQEFAAENIQIPTRDKSLSFGEQYHNKDFKSEQKSSN